MFKFSRPKAGVAALGAVGLCLGVVSPAMADIAPGTNDVVGTGSDTLQYTANFIFDGTTGGAPGYNTGKTNRVFSFDASADANGRAVYSDAAVGAPLLAATSVLRAGTAPVIRPNGSGNGMKSLYQAPYIAPGPVVNFARMSRLPTCAENTAAAAVSGVGGLHVYKFAYEDLGMAAKKTGSNAPAGLTPDQVLKIYTGVYTTWGDIPGYSGGTPGQTIVPLLPQAGSGTRGSFDADMKAANGNVTPTYSNAKIEVVQENDYASFANSSDPANAIAPFSGGRIVLNDSGYLGAAATNTVKPLLGTPPGGGSAYDDQRGLYFVVKEADVNSSTIFQPGGTKNFVKTLFSGATSTVASPAFAANITASGMTPQYADLGVGVPGQSCTS
jgi:ABC-type phosphate transport system substrate-binding protein